MIYQLQIEGGESVVKSKIDWPYNLEIIESN